ncbi:hypothetical protein GLYMA_14G178300v4 [Glycine max]|uniref:CCHC-type domain-containing protein n=2 Tax=Glycine subgen. Soja TaxID=1462606 RepID=A0A0R0GPQ8_SOYBN|nr:uncharacterized protein LOC100815444 isoform X1 [Glycine max]XP_028199244.1 uncharacterized protein LOC114383717 isoform X1 [Glycine soja]XP_028199245.1 uncharacterized protein LOC114383717 isoform X1 [Glycine soja]XP_028199246.1 uncharacterized protein LOC114383717 isoform X1 [Glycine soja]XP_040864945.1 uncharacterized protein LOC100815444 isoform X1 [Glycine max]XP_040864946.1 uncharacterized protein LOC100815444 isoform X1 [Glycine max]KAG4954809.1 hypothetical protein JHK87_040403 [Gl|eukprot:XP_014622755.1 uncharacterized protein LOC100815444 isoform X3 [Glycine max]
MQLFVTLNLSSHSRLRFFESFCSSLSHCARDPRREKMEGTRAGTATGSYKCGKPGHWLRDCPFSAPNSNFNLNPNPNSITATTPNPNTPNRSSSSFKPKSATKKPNMLPRTKPKLTPELLLSDDDLGYALRYFPRKFKYCGRGHEFVHKVEKVAATRRGKSMDILQVLVESGTSETLLISYAYFIFLYRAIYVKSILRVFFPLILLVWHIKKDTRGAMSCLHCLWTCASKVYKLPFP